MDLIDDYYIIESLEDSDIKDGKVFFDSLSTISGFNPKYRKVSNFNELKIALTGFDNQILNISLFLLMGMKRIFI